MRILYRRATSLHNEDEHILEHRDGNSAKNAPQASLDTIFLSQLRETERYEKGLIFRLLVWIPMLLAPVKIFSVTGGWSVWGPKVCGCMFFCSWFVTELITIVASRHQLSEDQREKVLKLGRLWRKSWEVRHAKGELETELRTHQDSQRQLDELRRDKSQRRWWEPQHEKMKSVAELLAIAASQRQQSKKLQDTVSKFYGLKEGKGTFEIALIDPWNLFFFWELESPFIPSRICCAILLGFNAWPLVSKTALTYFSPYMWYYIWVDSFLWQPNWGYFKHSWMSPVEILVLYFFVFAPFFLYAGAYVVLVYSAVSPWALQWALHVFGTMKLADMDRLMPGYLALGQAILTILRSSRVLNDYASYDCSTTTLVSWYDWTL
jgi:hypothetical protein